MTDSWWDESSRVPGNVRDPRWQPSRSSSWSANRIGPDDRPAPDIEFREEFLAG